MTERFDDELLKYGESYVLITLRTKHPDTRVFDDYHLIILKIPLSESKIPEFEESVTRMSPEPKPYIGTNNGEPDEVHNIPPHLLEVFKKAQNGRNKVEIKEMASLLRDFKDLFSMKESDIAQAAFVTEYGLYEFTRMSLGHNHPHKLFSV
ncbi:unnamed protein product [Mytilus edulis]|uniref:Uncharacterized protein n=1 Tax=Mytilus edulis TaxID=6550 RepID=A0A8S3SS67_MYTED|nr:unnamed protein product [Mytilus edulis]